MPVPGGDGMADVARGGFFRRQPPRKAPACEQHRHWAAPPTHLCCMLLCRTTGQPQHHLLQVMNRRRPTPPRRSASKVSSCLLCLTSMFDMDNWSVCVLDLCTPARRSVRVMQTVHWLKILSWVPINFEF
jgi:hypothetical protein